MLSIKTHMESAIAEFGSETKLAKAAGVSTRDQTLSAAGAPSREPLIVISMLICGALARFVVGRGTNDLSHFPSESHNVAVSLATTGRFADPFGYPSGPTAHIGMLTPLPSALAYWLFAATVLTQKSFCMAGERFLFVFPYGFAGGSRSCWARRAPRASPLSLSWP